MNPVNILMHKFNQRGDTIHSDGLNTQKDTVRSECSKTTSVYTKAGQQQKQNTSINLSSGSTVHLKEIDLANSHTSSTVIGKLMNCLEDINKGGNGKTLLISGVQGKLLWENDLTRCYTVRFVYTTGEADTITLQESCLKNKNFITNKQ